MTDVAKLQNVRLLFPNKKRLAWPVPVWSKYLVFTVSVCRSRNIEAGHYHIRSAIQPPAPPAATTTISNTDNLWRLEQWTYLMTLAGAGAGNIGRLEDWKSRSKMTYSQIGKSLFVLHIHAFTGSTHGLHILLDWFYIEALSSAWIWLDECSVYKFGTEEEVVEEFWWESWRILSP